MNPKDVETLVHALETMADSLRNAASSHEINAEFAWFQVGAVATTLKRSAIDIREALHGGE